LRVMK